MTDHDFRSDPEVLELTFTTKEGGTMLTSTTDPIPGPPKLWDRVCFDFGRHGILYGVVVATTQWYSDVKADNGIEYRCYNPNLTILERE